MPCIAHRLVSMGMRYQGLLAPAATTMDIIAVIGRATTVRITRKRLMVRVFMVCVCVCYTRAKRLCCMRVPVLETMRGEGLSVHLGMSFASISNRTLLWLSTRIVTFSIVPLGIKPNDWVVMTCLISFMSLV